MNLNNFFNFIFPDNFSCLCCGRDVFNNKYEICDSCKNKLHFLTGKLCKHCSEHLISDGNFCIHCKGKIFYCDKIISPFVYDGIVKNFILGLKYNNKKYYANSLSIFMCDTYNKNNLLCDLIIPVPLCDKRLKERGYNQSELLAKPISKTLNLPLVTECLIRVKQTPSQVNLNYKERTNNLIDAFKVINKKLIKDKTILLIDDVYTTGATITECAKTLKRAGAKVVYALTAAHTILKKDDITKNIN